MSFASRGSIDQKLYGPLRQIFSTQALPLQSASVTQGVGGVVEGFCPELLRSMPVNWMVFPTLASGSNVPIVFDGSDAEKVLN